MVGGFQRLVVNGYKHTPSDKIEEYKKRIANESDPYQMARFVKKRLIADRKEETSTRLIYQAHQQWCEDEHIESGKGASENDLSKALLATLEATGKYFDKDGKHGHRMYLIGWRLRTEDEIGIDIESGEDTKEASPIDLIMAEVRKWSPEKLQKYVDKLRTRDAEKAGETKAKKAARKAAKKAK